MTRVIPKEAAFAPAEVPEKTQMERREDQAGSPRKGQPRILIVEDDNEMRGALRDLFLMKGYAVNTAKDGITAAEIAWKDPYDVIVSDIRLPGMDGMAVTRTVNAGTHPPVVILITAYPEWKVYEEAARSGARYLLRKPLDLVRLVEIADEATGGGP